MDELKEIVAGINMGVAIMFLFVGICLGFLMGTRGRQLANSAKSLTMNLPKAFSFRIPIKPPADDEGKDDAENLGEEEEQRPEDIMEEFLSRAPIPGMDDHPELELNPVIMYQIKQAKAAKRAQMVREALRADGMTDEEIEERLESGMTGNAGNAGGKPSAFQILIDAGARVTPGANNMGSDQALIQERKRQVRTIDTFLSKERNIDISKETVVRSQRLLDSKTAGGAVMGPLQMALSTRTNPIGGSRINRTRQQVDVAKRGRNLLRRQKGKVTYVYKKEPKAKKKKAPKEHRGGMALDVSDLAAIAAEFEGEELEALGEEGADGEEDAELGAEPGADAPQDDDEYGSSSDDD